MGSAITIFPIAQKHRINKQGQVPIVLRIDFKSEPVAYDQVGEKPFKIPLQLWDNDRRKVTDGYHNAALINFAINKRRLALEEIFLIKEAQGLKLNKHRIKALVKGIDPGICFYSFCRKQIKEKYSNAEIIRTYITEVTKPEQYRKDLTFLNIDFSFLQRTRHGCVMSAKIRITPFGRAFSS